MLKAKDGDFFVTDWLRNRNTMEFLGVWERVYNPNFNYGEFATIRNQAGLNSFKISVKEFVARTGAISLQAKAGRYGGTYAHKDIAFEFATVGGLLLGKLMCKLSGGKINPLIGSAGVSAVPMAARVSQTVGAKANPSNFLLMHAMGPNVAGVIGSAVAAGFLLAVFGG